ACDSDGAPPRTAALVPEVVVLAAGRRRRGRRRDHHVRGDAARGQQRAGHHGPDHALTMTARRSTSVLGLAAAAGLAACSEDPGPGVEVSVDLAEFASMTGMLQVAIS